MKQIFIKLRVHSAIEAATVAARGGFERVALSVEDGVFCVASVETVAAGLAVLEREDVDVVLMDIDLPEVDGLEGTRRVKALRPGISAVVLTGIADIDNFVRALAAGADGFLAKDSPFESILAAVRRRTIEGMHLDDDTLDTLRTRIRDHGTSAGHAWTPELTDREREVLALLGEGLDPQTIAVQLGIGVHTCRGYVRNVLMKLGAHSQLEAVAVARHAGLLV